MRLAVGLAAPERLVRVFLDEAPAVARLAQAAARSLGTEAGTDLKSYGPIGVVTVLLSYLIGYGVCLHIGAVFGQMWSERHESPNSARSDSETSATLAK